MRAVIDLQTERANDIHGQARDAQIRWASKPIAQRLRVVRELRHLLAENAEPLAIAVAATNDRPMEEKLVSEVLPLADACRWLEKSAARVLAPRRSGSRGRPFWLRGFSFEVQRQPFGLVLVIGPGNYPLFLPAVHSLHALVAGNAVLLKPAPGTRNIALFFAKLARDAGLDPTLLTILPESVVAARDAIAGGVDKVIFTGSSENGRDVLADLAKSNTPAVMELSGEDAVLVFADADLELVVRSLGFGTRLNNGRTCIAPRRLIVVQSVADDLLARMANARVPRLPIERVRDEAAAARRANATDFALGASIFSRDIARARSLAARIKTGFVLINDLIAPTADPRLPFGGVKASGFGTTRGDEGLLAMTFPHVVAVRRGTSHPHFDETVPEDAKLFSSYIRAAHGRRRKRFSAIRDFIGALPGKIKNRKTNS
jgi:acyl-CoA reductase-like NAD-dependent aldehyde dehydrogenase